jgi:hypothetical protein
MVLSHGRKDLIQPHPVLLAECVRSTITSDVFLMFEFEHLIVYNTYSIQIILAFLPKVGCKPVEASCTTM